MNNMNSTSREPYGRTGYALTGTNYRLFHSKEKMINIQKREKLKGLLIAKFMKKYGIKNPETILEPEVRKFLEMETLTDGDLKQLDERIRRLINDLNIHENLRRGLSADMNNQNKEETINRTSEKNSQIQLPELTDNMSVKSKVSKRSNVSVKERKSTRSVCSEFDDLESMRGRKRDVERFDFEDQKDEWNAIVAYNKKLFDEEQRQNKLKDIEVKKRIREDLDNQIRQKKTREYEELMKNRDYDEIIKNHCDFLEDAERKKQQETKERIMKEKENRDKQLKDEKHRKKVEYMREKKYDKEIVKNLLNDIEREKDIKLKKKIEEKELLQQTLRENELNRLRQLDNQKKEKQDDVKATQEYTRILDRQEQERVEYFKKIERNSNNYINKLANSVLNNLDKKNKEEEDKMKAYLDEKEKKYYIFFNCRLKEEDMRRMQKLANDKKSMKEYLDMQVEEKKRNNLFEKSLDYEQARIWKIDTEKFHEQEQEVTDQVI